MENLEYQRIVESADYVRSIRHEKPEIGLILGTGLSGLSTAIEGAVSIPYAVIPHFPISTVPGHKGELILGKLSGRKVVAMAGRFHHYEGYNMKEVIFPVRVMRLLGIETLIISNATGSTNENFRTGEIAIIRDHINLHHENPLRGKNIDELGPRFPDLLNAYDGELAALARAEGRKLGIDLKSAVYIGVPGPNLETVAEFRYFSKIGADVVGMSTVPEVIAARHMGIRVLTLSVVTNEGYSESREEASLENIIEIARQASPVLEKLVSGVVAALPAGL